MEEIVIVHLHWHVLLFREDGVVGLQIILLQQLLAVSDLHIEEGVPHAKELVRLGGHGGVWCEMKT
jgi:hypothetical protein